MYKCYLNGRFYGSGNLAYMKELFMDYVIFHKMYGKEEVDFKIVHEQSELEKHRQEQVTKEGTTTKDSLDIKITDLLHELQFSAKLKGFAILREAIKLVLNDSDLSGGFSNHLYPMLAERFHTTPHAVERVIRHAIESSYDRNYFHPLYQQKFLYSKPTNTSLIAEIVDKFRLEKVVAKPLKFKKGLRPQKDD